jgi:ribonuclease-3
MAPNEESRGAIENLDGLEERLGYQFRNSNLLQQSLTHSSCRGLEGGQDNSDNERLEFLGDSIVGFIVSEALYQLSPDMPEGKLSRIKSNLVNAASFHRVAEHLELGRFLRLGPGEEKTGGRTKQALLSDAVEALVAALYLDGGLEAARRFVQENLLQKVEELGPESFAGADYKTSLQEYLQARRLPVARYDLAGETGPDHSKTFLVELWLGERRVSQGQGASKKVAEQRAAERALAILAEKEQT